MADFNSSLPIRTETDGDAVIKIVDKDGTNLAAVNASNEQLVKDTDAATAIADIETVLTNGTQKTIITDGIDDVAVNADGSINSVVTATDLDIRDLSHTQDSVKIGDGTDLMEVNTDGSINVKQASGAIFNVAITESTNGEELHQFATTVAGVPNTPSTVISYTVPALKTLMFNQVTAAGSGKIKVEVKIGTPSSETLRDVAFTSTSNPNVDRSYKTPYEVAAGDNVLVILTNKDTANQDLYATIHGVLV